MTALELCADWHRAQRQLQKLYTWPPEDLTTLRKAVALRYAIRENEFAAEAMRRLLAGQFHAANDE